MTDELRRIEQALLAYWAENPCAADTLEGVTHWLPAADRRDIAVVLDRLVRRGTVIAVASPRNGHVVYKLVR